MKNIGVVMQKLPAGFVFCFGKGFPVACGQWEDLKFYDFWPEIFY